MKDRWVFLMFVLNMIYMIFGGVCFSFLETDSDQNTTETMDMDMVTRVLQQLPGELLRYNCDLLPVDECTFAF